MHQETENLGFARLDHSRASRRGAVETIFCQGKTPEQVAAIFERFAAHDGAAFGTRASEEQYRAVLEKVRLADFLRGEQGLDTMLKEQGSNFSGGQRQRLALARALLHDSPVYIFDEATSNIDVESETLIMEVIETLAKTKTVLLITHRLANVVHADQIYVMEAGAIVERGSFAQLVNGDGGFAQLWNAQQALENYGKEQEHEEKQG